MNERDDGVDGGQQQLVATVSLSLARYSSSVLSNRSSVADLPVRTRASIDMEVLFVEQTSADRFNLHSHDSVHDLLVVICQTFDLNRLSDASQLLKNPKHKLSLLSFNGK